MHKLLHLIIIILFGLKSYSQGYQQKERDSIYLVISKMPADSNKVNALLKYGWWWETYNMDSAAQCYLQVHQLSKKINYVAGILKYYANYTFVLNQQGNYSQGLKLNTEALELAKSKGTTQQMARCLFNIGSSYNNLAEYNEAIKYYLQALKLLEDLNLKKDIAIVSDNIGGVFSNIGQNKKALTYYLKAIKKATEIADSLEIATAMLNAAGAYKSLGEYENAVKFSLTSLSISKKIKSTYIQINAELALAEIFSKNNEFDKGINYAKKSLQSSITISSIYSQMEALKMLTRCYSLKKDYQLTIQTGEQTILFAKQNNLVSDLHKIYELLALAYSETGNYKLGFLNLEIAKKIKDSINETDIANKIEQLEVKYQSVKNEKQILALEHTKEQQVFLIWSLLFGIFISLCLVYFIFKNYQQKRAILVKEALYKQQRIQELETERKLIVTESIIKGQEDERLRLAKDLHDGLGGILSSAKFSFSNMKTHLIITEENLMSFENGLTILDKSITELRRVAHNMMPEALVKFGLNTAMQDLCDDVTKNSSVQLHYQSFNLKDEDISPNKISTIYRVVQELINNIIKHAEAKTAIVQFIKVDNTLTITVEDDGKGFDTALLKNNSGIGYSNLYSRVAYINGEMDVQTTINKGTSVNIHIHNLKND